MIFSNPSSLGTNITIWDQNSTNQKWHKTGEDQEVEPGMAHGQRWDMEAFFLNGTTLSMVGGYNFLTTTGFKAGDIFIDIDGDAQYGDIHGNLNGNRTVKNTFGYDYVLDMNFLNFSYNIYKIDDTSDVQTSYYKQNQGSNPWLYTAGGVLEDENLGFNYNQHRIEDMQFLSNNFKGKWHNVVSGIDLGFLGNNIDGAVFHSTMQCGNDNLMGKGVGSPVPEPTTFVLFGLGLLGVTGFGRKKQLK